MATKSKVKIEKGASDFDYRTIKSFEDACIKMNIDSTVLPDVSMIEKNRGIALVANYKLMIIYEAINNGWIPDWSDYGHSKYYPWLKVEATKARSSGFGFSYSFYGSARTDTGVGSRLYTDTSDKAMYIAKQFTEEYKEYFLIPE